MGDYLRECPHCGGLTTHNTCEICGRRTNPTDKRLDSVQTSDTQDEKRQDGHIQTMVQQGRNYQKQPAVKKEHRYKPLLLLVSIALILIPIGIALFEEYQNPEEYVYNDDDFDDYDESFDDYHESIYEQYDDLENYLVTIQDTTPVLCEVDATDPDWYHLKNETPYIFQADVELTLKNGRTDTSFFYAGAPYGMESDYGSDSIDTCRTTAVEYQKLNLFNIEVPYEYVYGDSYDREIRIASISEEDLQLLLKRIYCMNILTFNTYDTTVFVVIDEVHAYDAEFDYEDRIIYLTDQVNGRTVKIPVII